MADLRLVSTSVPLPRAAEATAKAMLYVVPRDVSRRFGKRLQTLRVERNYTQLRIAWDLGLDLERVQGIEEGRESVTLATLEVIAFELHLSLSELLQGL